MQSILGNTRKPDIVFHSSGRIDITSRIARHLHIKHGDVLDVLHDGVEFYLYVKHRSPINGRHEASVYPTKKGGRNFRAWSARLCAEMMKRSAATGEARLCVGKPVEHHVYGTLLPIITKYTL